MNYVFDLDGTLCTDTKGDYEKAEPICDRIFRVNQLFDLGNEITIYTARGMGSCNNNPSKATEKFYALTQRQLKSWNVKHHHLFFGKPSGDVYVDDKGEKDYEFFRSDPS